MKYFLSKQYEVHAGQFNPRLMGVQERKITNYQVHPDYKDPAMHFDVAVILLEEPLIFSSNLQPVCLPTEARSSPRDILNWGLKVQGWSPKTVTDQNELILTEIIVNVG